MTVKAVLFDMDGVLLDSEPFHDETNLILLRKYGVEADKSVTNPYIGRTSTELWTALKERFHLPVTVEELIEEQWAMNIRNIPSSGIGRSEGLDPLLAFLSENKIRSTVASSSRRGFVEAVLEHLKLSAYMEGYTCGEEVEKSKPEPDIFLLAARKLGVSPEECVVIEDSTAGVRAGLAAGMFTIGYVNPTSEGQDVSPADQVVRHLADAVPIIRAMS